MNINQPQYEFFREVLTRYKLYDERHRLSVGTPPVVPPAAQKQLELCRGLVARYNKFGNKAEMVKMESLQVTQLANWLIQAWHDLHGSERVPAMQFTESGVGWMSEGQQ